MPVKGMKKGVSGGAAGLLGVMLVAGSGWAQSQQPAPDNSKANKQERSGATADQQKMNPADRETAKKIRAALHDDKSLSTYAHNVKVIVQNGQVTLKGPVRTEEEKSSVEAKATEIAGAGKVNSELTIAPHKS